MIKHTLDRVSESQYHSNMNNGVFVIQVSEERYLTALRSAIEEKLQNLAEQRQLIEERDPTMSRESDAISTIDQQIDLYNEILQTINGH